MMKIYMHDPKKTFIKWELELLILQLDLLGGDGLVGHMMRKENLKMTNAYGKKLLLVFLFSCYSTKS